MPFEEQQKHPVAITVLAISAAMVHPRSSIGVPRLSPVALVPARIASRRRSCGQHVRLHAVQRGGEHAERLPLVLGEIPAVRRLGPSTKAAYPFFSALAMISVHLSEKFRGLLDRDFALLDLFTYGVAPAAHFVKERSVGTRGVVCQVAALPDAQRWRYQ